jgi:2-(1,2-epoxy-1,2-dihydrophenyl)acetyl-CoA isomerase
MTTPAFDTIKLDVADTVATITLNRPDRLNSMPPAMADDIRGALDHLPGLGARALLITGRVGGQRRRAQPQCAAQPL